MLKLLAGYDLVRNVGIPGGLRSCQECGHYWRVTILSEMWELLACYDLVRTVGIAGGLRSCQKRGNYWRVTILSEPRKLLAGYDLVRNVEIAHFKKQKSKATSFCHNVFPYMI